MRVLTSPLQPCMFLEGRAPQQLPLAGEKGSAREVGDNHEDCEL